MNLMYHHFDYKILSFGKSSNTARLMFANDDVDNDGIIDKQKRKLMLIMTSTSLVVPSQRNIIDHFLQMPS